MLGNRRSLGPQLAFWIAAGFAFWVVLPQLAKQSWCPPQLPTERAILGNHPFQKNNDGGYPIWDFIEFKPPQANDQNAQLKDSSTKWSPSWLCEEGKITDFLLVYFTYCLVIVGWFTIRSAERTAADVERAYIGITGGEIYILPNNRVRVLLKATNQGKTPAYDVEHVINGAIRPPGDETMGDRGQNPNQKWPMAPTALWTLAFPLREFRADFALARDADAARRNFEVVVWGEITYRDTFQRPDDPPRRTTFCYRTGEWRIPPEGIKWFCWPESCREGNSMT
jgi:hypothetical protein